MVDVKRLVEWLGPEGAIAGLEKSDLTVAELRALAVDLGLAVSSKARRSELIHALVEVNDRKIDRTIEELLSMDRDALRAYLQNVNPSRRELLRVLAEIDVRPPGKGAGNLLDFVAREIGDIGMYQRVAKGHDSNHGK